MKKILSITLVLLLMISTSIIGVFAEPDAPEYTFFVDGTEYTVQFVETSLNEVQQEALAAHLVGVGNIAVVSITPGEECNNLWCTLFGHDYTESIVNVITHRVSNSAPRCKNQRYSVQVCDRCEDTVQTLISTSYIYCCD